MADIVRELTELNTAFANAEFTADVEFFGRYLADGLRFRRAAGKVVDKGNLRKDLAAPRKQERTIAGSTNRSPALWHGSRALLDAH